MQNVVHGRKPRTIDGKPDLQSLQVDCARAFVSLLDVELDFLSLFEIRTADVFHVEEDVLLRILTVDKAVTAGLVEEINRTLRHCNLPFATHP